jgi:raffinose/stachyose/melibiose transport system permease protein
MARGHGRTILHATLFIAPALIVYSVFAVYPLLSSLVGSFFHWQGFERGSVAGLDNFGRLLGPVEGPVFTEAFVHNVEWFLGIMAIQNVVGLSIAYLLYRRQRRAHIVRVIIFLPAILSPVLVGALWRLLLAPNGPLNDLLVGTGIASQPIAWLGDRSLALWSLILVDAWNWLGLPLLVFYAGFAAISGDIVEAANLDGAGEVRLLLAVALPLVVPSIMVITILTFINTFNQFDIVYVMAGVQGNPSHATDVLGTYFYRLAFGAQGASGLTDIGLALVVATCLFVLLAIGSVVGLRVLGTRIVRY